MAKMPGWIRVRRTYVEDGMLYHDISINWWHPVAWLTFAREFVKKLVSRCREG